MKNALLLLAGGLAAYGVWWYVKNEKKKPAGPVAGVATNTQPVLTIIEERQYIPAYEAMIQRYDARPEVLFAPPMAYVSVPGAGVTDLVTSNMPPI